MKRYGNLYEQIYSMDNLRKAHKNARKGKGWYEEVKEVDANIEVYLKQLQEMLINHSSSMAMRSMATVMPSSNRASTRLVSMLKRQENNLFILEPPVCIHPLNPVGRVPARMNLGQLNSSRVIMAHRDRVFDSWCHSLGYCHGYQNCCSCRWFPCRVLRQDLSGW